MEQQTKWPWKVYFFIAIIPGIKNIVALFIQDTELDQYYRILIAFKESYRIWYYLNIAAFAVEALSLLPLIFFVFHRKFLPALIWQILFITRVALLFTGHSYEVKHVQSFFHMDIRVAVAAVLIIFLFTLPSYLAHFYYAFRQDKLFPKPIPQPEPVVV